MNKKQLPENIMSKIEQEAKDYGRKVAPLRFTDTNEDYLADVARQDYIEGRTASVQPLIDALQKISDRKRSLVLPFDAYKDKDEARKMCVALNDIDELATEALSSFPSILKPIEGGLRWVKAINEIPDISKCVIVRWFHSGNPDWIRVDISNGKQLLHWVNNNSVDIDSLEWLSESPNNTGEWMKDRPKFEEPCLLITRSQIRDYWDYSAYIIDWVKSDGGRYMGWLCLDGEEYDDLSDLQAQYYCVLPLPEPPKQ